MYHIEISSGKKRVRKGGSAMPDKVPSCKDGELPLVLTVAEAGEALRIGRTAAYSIVRCGKLRSVRVGRTIRVPRDAIAEFLRA